MTLSGVLVVFLTSLTALPVSYLLNSVSHLKDQRLILIAGLLSYGLVTGVPWLILRRRIQKADPLLYVLSLLAFQSVLSLVIALENDGLIAEFIGFYLREGEPYLKTAHGTMISYWDGVAHFGLYLMMLAAVSWNQGFCEVGLYWVGSFAYGKLVLVLAVLMGNDGLRSPFLLNIPCIIICALLSLRFLDEKYADTCQKQKDMREGGRTTIKRSIWKRKVDLCMLVYYGFAVCFTILRFTAVMGGNVALAKYYCEKLEPYLTDPTPFPKVQVMVQTFYFVPFYLLGIYALLWPGQAWYPKWALVMAGAVGQGQFSFMGASFHYRTPYIHRLPQTSAARFVFWTANGAMFVLPQFAGIWYISKNQFFLQSQQEEDLDQNASITSNGSAKKTD